MPDQTKPRPFWIPDTQSFLAIAIVVVLTLVILILLLKDYANLNEKVYGALLTLLGVVAACFKDVYSFFFGSSKGSEKKDDAIMASALTPTPPAAPQPGTVTTTVTSTAEPVAEPKPV